MLKINNSSVSGMSEELKTVLKKMCEMVGAEFDKIDFEKTGWFSDYSWSLKQEKEFVKWMRSLLKNNSVYRNALMDHPTVRVGVINYLVDEFVFNYGWKYK